MADASDIGERAISAAKELLKQGQQVAKREARIIRLQSQISRLRSQRLRLLHQMGEKVYDLFQRELVKNQDLRMMCQQIRGLEAEIEMRREEIEQTRRPEGYSERGVDDEPEARYEPAILDDADQVIRD